MVNEAAFAGKHPIVPLPLLQAAVGTAVTANKGFRAVSVFSETKDGHSIATMTLVKGQDWKTVSEMLD